MTRETKQEIVAAMRQYQEQKKLSQNDMAGVCDLSSAHMSYVFNEKHWGKVSEDLWRRLRNQFVPRNWKVYPTGNFNMITRICEHAKIDSRAICVSDYPGAGKTMALQEFARVTPNVFYIECNSLMTNKEFLRQIQRAMLINVEGTAFEMLLAITDELRKLESPLIIFDEFEKLKDSCLMSAKVIYDRMEVQGELHCGFVTAGTQALKDKLYKFALKRKIGYEELKRRFANYARPLRKFNTKDSKIIQEVRTICADQGIEDNGQINAILQKAENYKSLHDLIKDFQKLNERNERQQEVEPQTAEAA